MLIEIDPLLHLGDFHMSKLAVCVQNYPSLVRMFACGRYGCVIESS